MGCGKNRIGIHYVLREKVFERFLGFYDAHDLSAESLFSIIKDVLISHSLNLNFCVAQ